MPKDSARATKIILPGVGHFGQMMRALDQMQVRDALLDRIRAGVPFLGICLGLQALFEKSEEAPDERGLGLYSRRDPPLSRRRARSAHGLERNRAAQRRAAASQSRRASVSLLRAQLLRAADRCHGCDLHLLGRVHGGARIEQRLRRAVSSGEVRPAGTADRPQLRSSCSDAGQAHHSLPRRHRRPRRQRRELRRAARRRRSGGAGRALQRSRRRRAGLPRHHRFERRARHHGRPGGAHRAQGFHPADGGRRDPLGRRCAQDPAVRRREGQRQHGRGAAPEADHAN